MIRYSLVCETEHGFDGWFRSSSDFDGQAEKGFVTCPVCGSTKIRKALMAPALATTENRQAAVTEPSTSEFGTSLALLSEKEQAVRAMLRNLREHVVQNAENVGDRFADVARQMHEGEIERASVWGQASPDEARSLAEEGIEFFPLPVLPDDGN